MKKTTILSLLVLLVAGVSTVNAQITEKPQYGKIAITGGTIHTVTNGVIQNGVVLIENDKITFVGPNARIDAGYHRVNATGKHVYPGMMDSQTSLGLVEIGQVPVTVDNRELGNNNPHIMAFTAINPHSASVPVTRVNGVTHVIAMPAGNGVAGKATLIDLWGYSPDSMAIQARAGLNMSWPSNRRFGFFDRRTDKQIKDAYDRAIKQMNDMWSQAVFYNEMVTNYEADPRGKEVPDRDVRLEAMREAVTGEIPIIITVDRDKDILNALEWIKEHPEARFILNSVREGWRVANQIAAANVPVITTTLYTPVRQYDNYQRPYQNPGLMAKAGVKVLLASGETENVRNLPYNAGYAATYGMGKEEALKAVTIYPAEVFGVADRLGSIEEGKQANLIIADGDPFEPLTNIEQVFIRGYKIPMVSRHTQLYEEFLDRDAVNKN